GFPGWRTGFAGWAGMPFTLGFPKDECAGLSEGECNSPLQIFAKMNGIGFRRNHPGYPFFILNIPIQTRKNPENPDNPP
ncbi:MAG: hypothetical protein ACLFN9_14215, partial [Desulfococcaceae bacterium]